MVNRVRGADAQARARSDRGGWPMSDVNDPTDLANNSELIADLARFSEGVLTEQQIRRK
jgi:hypothetical protein